MASTSKGTLVGYSATLPADFDDNAVTGYPSLTYTTLDGSVNEVPEFGPTANVTQFTPLNTGVIQKILGSIDNGQITIPMAIENGNAGQEAMFAAAGTDVDFAFEINVVPVDTAYYFTGKVSAFKINPGDANAVAMSSMTLEITRNIVKVEGP